MIADHVPILDDLMFVRHIAVPGNDDGPAFSLVLVDRPGQRVVERPDLPIDAAAVVDVDERILSRREHVAGNDHISASEMDDAVAIGDGVLLPEQLD